MNGAVSGILNPNDSGYGKVGMGAGQVGEGLSTTGGQP